MAPGDSGAQGRRSGPTALGGEPEAVEIRTWQGEPVDVWRDRWELPALRIFQSVGSTNDVARAMAEDGAPQGATVLAETQTRGRGRRGREWASHDQQSISLSMVVRPSGLPSEAVLSIRLGLASARAVEALLPLAVGVKWPNDLMVDGRKVAGMLCEGVSRGGSLAYIIAGHGINVFQPDHLWTGELAGQATSLAARTDAAIDRVALLGAVLGAWREALAGPGGPLTAAEQAEVARRNVLTGRSITVDGRPAGVVEGVDADGSLRIRRGERTERVVSGTVRIQETGDRS